MYIYIIKCEIKIVHTDNRLITAVTLANDWPVLSSERTPYINKPAIA
jgi:hypothetical protein